MAFAFEGGAPDPYAQFYGVQPHYAYYAPPPQPAPIQQQPAPAAGAPALGSPNTYAKCPSRMEATQPAAAPPPAAGT